MVQAVNSDSLKSYITKMVAFGTRSTISDTKRTASHLLSQTDWQVIKATEVSDYTVPSDVTTYRAAVRTASNTIEAAITGAADQAALTALSVTPLDSDGNPTGNAPINDWPNEG